MIFSVSLLIDILSGIDMPLNYDMHFGNYIMNPTLYRYQDSNKFARNTQAAQCLCDCIYACLR